MATTPRFIRNPGGPTLGVTSAPVLEVDGLSFKDLERAGTLLRYEDWRLPPEERAGDLAARLTVEEIAGLMMYSAHQMVPAVSVGPFVGTYGGKSLEESGAEPSGLLPVQIPADMETVERHCEDKPLDMIPYRDSAGNAYDFGFGLNWSGVIRDDRTRRYRKA